MFASLPNVAYGVQHIIVEQKGDTTFFQRVL